jgi:very-short-patch-repair endonuclease
MGVSMSKLRARQLRKTMTPQEVKLWVQVKYLNREGRHFRRQVSIDGYILDFAEFSERLIIEVDGSQNGFAKGEASDRIRDKHFAEAGFQVVRFWNNEVDQNMDGVINTVLAALPPIRLASLATFPAKGEGEELRESPSLESQNFTSA